MNCFLALLKSTGKTPPRKKVGKIFLAIPSGKVLTWNRDGTRRIPKESRPRSAGSRYHCHSGLRDTGAEESRGLMLWKNHRDYAYVKLSTNTCYENNKAINQSGFTGSVKLILWIEMWLSRTSPVWLDDGIKICPIFPNIALYMKVVLFNLAQNVPECLGYFCKKN